MLQKFIDLKNELLALAEESNETIETLLSKKRYIAAEYFRGKESAYTYAAERLEDLIKKELPWEE